MQVLYPYLPDALFPELYLHSVRQTTAFDPCLSGVRACEETPCLS